MTNRGELYVYGDIVNEKWFDDEVAPAEVVDLLNEMSAMQVSDIDVYINSPGGSVFAGTAIYSALKRHPAAVTVQIDGLAASIASVIAMAGDLITISDVGMMMVHSPWSIVMGNSSEMRKQADVLDKVEEAMVNAYSRTEISDENLAKMLEEETWLTAAEAVELGFADEVIQIADIAAMRVPADRFKHTPAALLLPEGSVAPPADPPEEPPAEPPEPTAPPQKPATTTKGGSTMPTEDELKAARDNALADARAEEQARKDGIAAIFKKFPQHADLRAECIEDGDCTVEAAGDKLLNLLADGATPLGGATRIDTVEDDRTKFRAGIVDGILQRSLVNDRDDSNPYRGFSMRDVARACVARMPHTDIPLDQMSTEQIVRAALTSESDFPVLYEEAFHKTLLSAFRTAPDTWNQFMSSGTLSDFRPHNRYRMGTFGDLPTLEENGEIKHTKLDDATKEIIQAEERGMIFTLSFKMIVDDDLQGMTNIARQFGRSAKRTVEHNVYDLLNSNPVMNDGIQLFHASHNNIGTAAQISVDSLGEARALMRRQMDPSSNEYIDLLPSILLCPVELGDKARQVLNSESVIGENINSGISNPVRNMVSVVDTPQLTGTAWYVLAAPSDTGIGEVGFLNGNSEPDTRMEEYFDARGIKYRVTYDFGMAMLEYRAGVMNAGA